MLCHVARTNNRVIPLSAAWGRNATGAEVTSARRNLHGSEHKWLARLDAAIRPQRRENLAAAGARLRSLIDVLGAQPELAAAVNAHLGTLLTSRMHRILYAESGVLTNVGFMSGLTRRLLGLPLPPAVDTESLRDLVVEVFDDPRDHVWMSAVSRADRDALLRGIDVDGDAFAPARR